MGSESERIASVKVKREELLEALKFANLGVSLREETLEQSNTFVFTEEELITFNDEVMTRSPTPLPDVEGAVVAKEFMALVEKLPDEELDVSVKGEEIILKGKRRTAGVTCYAEVALPYDAVPLPEKWRTLKDNVLDMLQQAARTCGKDVTQELTLMVHITKDLVEACDNFRLFRATLPTGFPGEGLLMATSVFLLDGLGVKKVALGEGWAHWKTESNRVISLRCSAEKYHDKMDKVLRIGEAEETGLPANLGEIVSRAMVTMSGDEDPAVSVALESGKLSLSTRKAEGWYKEVKRVKYDGDGIEFLVHPKFLVEMLKRTRRVLINPSRMKMSADGVEFVVALVNRDN